MIETPRILVVVQRPDLLSKIDELLDRRSLTVHTAPSAAAALVLLGNVRYDLLIAESPPPDLSISEFLSSLRALDSTCSGASAIILTDEAEIAFPPGLTGAPIEVLPVDSADTRLHQLISRLLGVAARRSRRLLVDVQVELQSDREEVVFESVNVSQTGLLLRGHPPITVGSRLTFQFELPSGQPISGSGVVTRWASAKEPFEGVAIRFEEVDPNGVRALDDFLLNGSGDEAVSSIG